jgi:hypothetical protein
MTLQVIKQAIQDKKMSCPTCHKPISKFEKYVDMIDSAYDGPGSGLGADPTSTSSKVTLICGNGSCDWKERTEYWANYIH